MRYEFVKEKGRVSVEGVKSLWDDRLSARLPPSLAGTRHYIVE